MPADHFEIPPDGWLQAGGADGQPVGFVLLALLKPAKCWKGGRTQGTVYDMGVLHGQRGRGHAVGLLGEARRRLAEAGCWRGFCDTGSRNAPMLRAFRTAGFGQRAPWQRPLR